MGASWLSIAGLDAGYGERLLIEGLDLEVGEPHRALGILGRSGIGKSTLLNLVAGFMQPFSGRIEVNGEVVLGPSSRRPVVFQEHNLFPWMTVAQNIGFGLKARGMSPAEREGRVGRLLEEFHLGDAAHRFPRELSGGMQQRVGIARALAVSPGCVLMDEPFGALDARTRESLYGVYLKMLTDHDMRSLHVTHSIEEAVTLCSAVLLLSGPSDWEFIDLTDSEPREGWLQSVRARVMAPDA